MSPPSIILTTLCGGYYKNRGNIFDEIVHIVNSIKANPSVEIYNPVNPLELLSEKWDKNPTLYNSFTEWINSLCVDLELLKSTENKEEKLKKMFGERIVKPILDELNTKKLIHKKQGKTFCYIKWCVIHYSKQE